MIRRCYWLDEADLDAIAAIRARYGCSSDSDAVRLALRLVHASPPAEILPAAIPRPEIPPGGAAPAALALGLLEGDALRPAHPEGGPQLGELGRYIHLAPVGSAAELHRLLDFFARCASTQARGDCQEQTARRSVLREGAH